MRGSMGEREYMGEREDLVDPVTNKIETRIQIVWSESVL
jgi:hypothetical protein